MNDRPTFGVERLNALTDGVFAIVLTLLVLELKLPEGDMAQPLARLLVENWHVFVAWLISFLAIARFWVVHHQVTAHLSRCHSGTLALNMLILLVVAVVPFSADVLGSSDIADVGSTVLFAVNLAALSFTVGMLARHTEAEPDLQAADRPVEALRFHRAHHLYRVPVAVLLAGAVAVVEPLLAVAALLVEFVIGAAMSLRRG